MGKEGKNGRDGVQFQKVLGVRRGGRRSVSDALGDSYHVGYEVNVFKGGRRQCVPTELQMQNRRLPTGRQGRVTVRNLLMNTRSCDPRRLRRNVKSPHCEDHAKIISKLGVEKVGVVKMLESMHGRKAAMDDDTWNKVEERTHMYTIISSRVNITLSVYLEAVWNPGVRVRKDAPVREGMCDGVDVVRVTNECRKSEERKQGQKRMNHFSPVNLHRGRTCRTAGRASVRPM